jgi:hypothetical protein
VDEATLRKIIREEIRRGMLGLIDRWADGCPTCGAATHGSATRCPAEALGLLCVTGKPHKVEVVADEPGYKEIRCTGCGATNWQRSAHNTGTGYATGT